MERFKYDANNKYYIQVICGLFLISFFGHILSSVLYSIIVTSEDLKQRMHFCLASNMYYLSTMCSFAAIIPLVTFFGYNDLKMFLLFVLFGIALSGYLAISIPTKMLMKVPSWGIILILMFSILTALILTNGLDANTPDRKIFFNFILPSLSIIYFITFCFGQIIHLSKSLIISEKVYANVAIFSSYLTTISVFYICFFVALFNERHGVSP